MDILPFGPECALISGSLRRSGLPSRKRYVSGSNWAASASAVPLLISPSCKMSWLRKKRWISNGSFLHALSHCMMLPARKAQQLAIYIGWKLHGKRGGIVAGTLFVLPSLFVLWR